MLSGGTPAALACWAKAPRKSTGAACGGTSSPSALNTSGPTS